MLSGALQNKPSGFEWPDALQVLMNAGLCGVGAMIALLRKVGVFATRVDCGLDFMTQMPFFSGPDDSTTAGMNCSSARAAAFARKPEV